MPLTLTLSPQAGRGGFWRLPHALRLTSRGIEELAAWALLPASGETVAAAG